LKGFAAEKFVQREKCMSSIYPRILDLKLLEKVGPMGFDVKVRFEIR